MHEEQHYMLTLLIKIAIQAIFKASIAVKYQNRGEKVRNWGEKMETYFFSKFNDPRTHFNQSPKINIEIPRKYIGSPTKNNVTEYRGHSWKTFGHG